MNYRMGTDERADGLNLILTRECPKRCSFCFTGDYSKETEMSVDFVDRLLTQFGTSVNHIKLLGGEPTGHSEFQELVNLVSIRHNKSYLLITNLLFSNRTLEFLIHNYHNRSGMLINGMELFDTEAEANNNVFTPGTRIKLFKKNWDTYFAERGDIEGIVLSLTISKNHTIEYFREYIRALKKELIIIPHLRIGLDLTNTEIAENTNYGKIIRTIQEELPRSTIIFDCQIPPCIFDYKPDEVLWSFTGLFHICNITPLDVFHDGSVIQCYPTGRKIKVDNIFEYYSRGDLNIELRRQYKVQEKNINILDVCKTCSYYLDNQCNSLCVGCYEGGHGLETAKINKTVDGKYSPAKGEGHWPNTPNNVIT